MRWKLWTFALVSMAAHAEVKIEKTAYQGWENCYRISNESVELIVTGDVGPRIIRYAFIGGQNIFKEFSDQLGKSGESEYQVRGGHRLWVAPEDLKTSWALDNGPVNIRVDGATLIATEPADSAGLEKQITVKLSSTGTGVEVVHRIKNANSKSMQLAPWALTVLTQGGTGITGFPPRGKHPDALLPTNPLVMWAYTDLSDRRWMFNRKYLMLRQDFRVPEPQKIGLFNENTWSAYYLGTMLFIKQTQADASRRYPDYGCSFETFVNGEILEQETLGPLSDVESGGFVEHVERWSLHRNIRIGAFSESELDRVVAPLLKQ